MSDATTPARSGALPRREFRRQALIALSLLFVVVAVGASLFMMQNVDRQVQDMGQTYQVRQHVRSLIQHLVDAETGQRGYLLTRDPQYLDPYRDSIASIDRTYGELLVLVADNPAELAQLENLHEPIARLRTQLAETINMVAENRVMEAFDVVRDDTGRARMDELRGALNAFLDREDLRLAERVSSFQATRLLLMVTMISALAGSVVLTYLLFVSAQRRLASLARTSAELQSLNAELEARVAARTAELEVARSHAERERDRVEMLLQETSHRVGNSLATVSSMLGLQVARSTSPDVRAALEAAQHRVQTIASAHRRLRLGDDFETVKADDFLAALVEDLLGPQAEARGIRIETRLDPMVIPARDATTVGILAGELVTNALKHAFPESRSGTVLATLTREADGTPVLIVEDDGEGLPTGHTDNCETGLGGMIVRQLAQQFGGELTYEQRSGGGTRVSLPLPGLTVDAAGTTG